MEDYCPDGNAFLQNMSSHKIPTERFCVATPTGRGAVATVSVFGMGGLKIVREHFKPVRKKLLSENDVGRIVYGNWKNENGPGEDLVVCILDEQRIDIHCHGGEQSVKLIAKSLIEFGAEQCDVPEFAELVLNNHYFADLQLGITQAKTTLAAKWLFDQPHWHEKFLTRLSHYIDKHKKQSGCRLIDNVMRWQDFGTRITCGFTVVLCGEPNVGKSSLVNSILGFDRAIVHNQAGTTRDLVETTTSLDGWPVRLVDTAGLQESTDQLEQMGIEQARQKTNEADIVVLVVDSTKADEKTVEEQFEYFRPDVVVANKADLQMFQSSLVNVSVSATEGTGVQQLIEILANRISVQAPPRDQPFPVSVFQVTSLSTMSQYFESYYWHAARTLLDRLLPNPNSSNFI